MLPAVPMEKERVFAGIPPGAVPGPLDWGRGVRFPQSVETPS